jgi:hypothetical protein
MVATESIGTPQSRRDSSFERAIIRRGIRQARFFGPSSKTSALTFSKGKPDPIQIGASEQVCYDWEFENQHKSLLRRLGIAEKKRRPTFAKDKDAKGRLPSSLYFAVTSANGTL